MSNHETALEFFDAVAAGLAAEGSQCVRIMPHQAPHVRAAITALEGRDDLQQQLKVARSDLLAALTLSELRKGAVAERDDLRRQLAEAKELWKAELGHANKWSVRAHKAEARVRELEEQEKEDGQIDEIGRALGFSPADEWDGESCNPLEEILGSVKDLRGTLAVTQRDLDSAVAALCEAAEAFAVDDRERMRLILCDTHAQSRASELRRQQESKVTDLRRRVREMEHNTGEHQRLHQELNILLNPDPESRPQAPMLCDLVRSVRSDLTDLRRQLDEAQARVRELEGQVIALAKLASDTPQFFNPLHAMAAQDLRDRILAAGCPAEEGEAT